MANQPMLKFVTVERDMPEKRAAGERNRDFDEMVRDGSFRQDLLYRLAIMSLSLPPLRARSSDIPALIAHFIKRFAREYERPAPRTDEASLTAAMRYGWPGNIRELENAVHRQFLLAENGVLYLELPGTERRGTIDGESGLGSLDMKSAKAKVIADFERDYLETVIAAAGGNVSAAARQAGKERRAFGKLLKKYGIDRARF